MTCRHPNRQPTTDRMSVCQDCGELLRLCECGAVVAVRDMVGDRCAECSSVADNNEVRHEL